MTPCIGRWGYCFNCLFGFSHKCVSKIIDRRCQLLVVKKQLRYAQLQFISRPDYVWFTLQWSVVDAVLAGRVVLGGQPSEAVWHSGIDKPPQKTNYARRHTNKLSLFICHLKKNKHWGVLCHRRTKNLLLLAKYFIVQGSCFNNNLLN